VHLHFEVWVNEQFLGEGLPADRVRAIYERLFGVSSAGRRGEPVYPPPNP
jgi:hypothetical protein